MNQNDMDRYYWRTGHYWNRDPRNSHPSTRASYSGMIRSETRHREHQSLHASLLEVVVGGECFGEATPFHDYDGQAIGEAPILVAAAPVQIDCKQR